MKEPVVQIGDSLLRCRAKIVQKKQFKSRALARLIARMKKILKKELYGVALAAPQVGSPLRLFVVSGRVFAKSKATALVDRVFINPELLRYSKKMQEMSEGCLSVRDTYGTVMRHEKVTLKAQDEKGMPIIYHASGLIAQIFQHEVDHLNGILYVDKAKTLGKEVKKKS